MPIEKYCIVGNAGSGKTTLAQSIQKNFGGSILDLDTITWDRAILQKRRPIESSLEDLLQFIKVTPTPWIIEGCYGELIEAALISKPKLIFLDPGEEACLKNCRDRPWESHKYSSKVEQDKFLQFLLSWVSEYYRREGPMSYKFHEEVFNRYQGPKIRIETFDADALPTL